MLDEHLTDTLQALRQFDDALLAEADVELYTMAVGRALLMLGSEFSQIITLMVGWHAQERNEAGEWVQATHTQSCFYREVGWDPIGAGKIVDGVAAQLVEEAAEAHRMLVVPALAAQEEARKALAKAKENTK